MITTASNKLDECPTSQDASARVHHAVAPQIPREDGIWGGHQREDLPITQATVNAVGCGR